MKQKWIILLFVAVFAVSCSGNGRQRQFIGGQTNIPATPGSRLAAVLNQGTSCSSLGSVGDTNSFGTGIRNPLQSNVPVDQQGGQNINNSLGLNSDTGSVQILNIFENSPMVGQSGNVGGQTLGNSYLSSGVSVLPVGRSIYLQGVTRESQIAYTSDGGLLLITLPGRDEVLGIPTYDNGAMGAAYRIGVGPHPTEIATTKAADGVEYAAVTTRAGLSMLAIDRVDARSGSPVPGALRERVRIDLGMPTAVAFSPTGEWLFIGTNPTGRGGASGAGGRVYACRRESIVNHIDSPSQTMGREELGRGCGWTPDTFTGRRNSNDPFPAGRQTVGGIPLKIAIRNDLAVTLTNPRGPYLLQTPDVEDMDKEADDLQRSGYLNEVGWAQSNGNVLGRSYRDIAIHPRSGNVITIESGRLMTYAMDNSYERRTKLTLVDEVHMGSNLSAIAMDPGPDAQFALVTDEGTGKVLVGRLDALSVRFNRVSDYVQMTGGCPIDVAVRARQIR